MELMGGRRPTRNSKGSSTTTKGFVYGWHLEPPHWTYRTWRGIVRIHHVQQTTPSNFGSSECSRHHPTTTIGLSTPSGTQWCRDYIAVCSRRFGPTSLSCSTRMLATSWRWGVRVVTLLTNSMPPTWPTWCPPTTQTIPTSSWSF